MNLQQKLSEYFEENGIKKKWFCEIVGMPVMVLYQVLHARIPMPIKYWKKIIAVTNGKITLTDLMEYHLGKPEELSFTSKGKGEKCEISLRNLKIKKD